MQTTFADTILNIAITGPLVRIDLGTITHIPAGTDGKATRRATASQQLVMPLDGFVRAFGMQEKVVKKLIADGVLQAQTRPKAAAKTAAEPKSPK